MKFRLVVVGKPRDKALAAAITAYETRAARYWPLETLELRDESGAGASAQLSRRREGERILERLEARTIVACDEQGEPMRSDAFARWMQVLRERASDVDFVIGGPYGLDEAVRTRATKTLALAAWTMSHELARLVLAEQLYRAGTIVRGEPYHK
jgi:23S rRNA (pseudouridine1915-N3)-methyltransferase